MQTVQNKENSQKDSNVPVPMQSISVVPAKTVPVRGEQPFKMNITEDYTSRYWESTQETLVGLYAKRDPITGQPVEGVNEIIHRVATSVAVAELKYALKPEELVKLTRVLHENQSLLQIQLDKLLAKEADHL